MLLGGGYGHERRCPERIVIPSAKVTEVGEVVYNDGDPVGYETTLSTVPDESGQTHYEYISAKGAE